MTAARRQKAEKRGGGALPLALDELSECVPAPGRVEHALEEQELADSIDRFLRTLPERECSISCAGTGTSTPYS